MGELRFMLCVLGFLALAVVVIAGWMALVAMGGVNVDDSEVGEVDDGG